jgi:hypothetical protein
MRHYPASRAPAPLAGLTVSEKRTRVRPWRATLLLVALASLAVGIALGFVLSAHAALPSSQLSTLDSQLSAAP